MNQKNLSTSADRLEDDIVTALPAAPLPSHPWQTADYRAGHFVKSGLLLGALAGCTSLLFNILGSVVWPDISGEEHHLLRIIQVYLTFPFGEMALHLQTGYLLGLGAVLYLITGMLYGMLFEWATSYFIPLGGLAARLVFCSALALAVWAINFYAVLIWVQPLLFGHRWIVDLIPWWVAAATHLVYGWTMACIYPLGQPREQIRI